jgi:ABC-2 type transport system permease protein
MPLAVATLWRREMVRFFRQPNRVVGALGTPLLFWFFLGTGMSPYFEEGDYLGYFFPGIAILIVHFTAILSTISIVEDRREGFLQSVLVSPASRVSIVLGKMLGGASVAVLQGALFLLLAPAVGVPLCAASFVASAAVLGLVAFALTGLGFAIAWRMDSTQGFHAVMNLFLMPMWFLSGAVFPADKAPAWLGWIMAANPLSYGVSALRAALSGELGVAWGAAAAATAAFGAVTFAAACAMAVRRSVAVAGLLIAALLAGAQGCAPKLPIDGEIRIPDFRLTNQRGEPFGAAELRGKVWIADFVFTRCQGPCPMMSYRMKQLQERLPAAIELVSFSVDPVHDTPEVLREYARRYDAVDGRWWFLTGGKKEIHELSMEGFKLAAGEEYEKDAALIIHDERFVLVDPEGRIRGYYMGTEPEAVAKLQEDSPALLYGWRRVLPHLNAALNSICAILLVAGLVSIKRSLIRAHLTCMGLALGVSALFLTSYIVYHLGVGSKSYGGEGAMRAVYFAILISHSFLAAAVVPLALVTVWRAWKGRFERHKAIARWTLPIWLYVSVTGVVVYWMLYR